MENGLENPFYVTASVCEPGCELAFSQVGFSGVVGDVAHDFQPVRFVADNAVPIVLLPELTLPFGEFVDLPAGESFPRFQHVFDLPITQSTGGEMYMIRHEDEAVQGAALVFEE